MGLALGGAMSHPSGKSEGRLMMSRHDQYNEDVAGRANVEDTPELVAYYDDLEKKGAGALWTVANKIEPWEPQSSRCR
jgi:gentisate 1,2-dioxygenase